MEKLTKKEFKDHCYHAVYGRGENKKNAIYYGYTRDGYKYMVKTSVLNYKLPELYNILYEWVTTDKNPIFYVQTRFAETDEQRFKVSVSG